MSSEQSILDSAKISLLREIALATSSNLGGTIAAFFQTVVLAWFLNVSQVGEFFIYLAVVFTVSQLFKGIGIALRKRASSVDEKQSQYLYASVILSLSLLLPIVVVGLLFGESLGSYTGFTVTNNVIYAILFATVAKGSNSLFMNYLSGVGKPGLAESIRNYVIKGGQLGLLFIGLSLSATVSSALTWYGITAFIGSSLYLYFSPTESIKPTKETFKEVFHFAKWSIPNGLLNDFYLRLDTLALGVFVTATAAGWYDVSVRVALFSFIISRGVSKTIAVKFSGMYESGIDFGKELRWSIRVSTYLIYPTLLLMFLHGESILVFIYSSEYAGAYWYLIGILAYLILQAYRTLSESVFNAIDQPQTITVASTLAVIVNVAVIYPLIMRFGGLGVVYSTLFAELFRTVFFAIKLREYLSLNRKILYQPLLTIVLLGVLQYGVFTNLTSLSEIHSITITSTVILFCYLIPLGYSNIMDQPQAVEES